MSKLRVEICRIEKVEDHPNADRLDLVSVAGWQCVVTKGNFKEGDTCIYIPIDSVLPSDVEAKIFGPDSKVKLSKSRVKTIKLRGAISQGLAIKPELLLGNNENVEGVDVSAILGITKYEPPIATSPEGSLSATPRKKENSNFKKYTDISNLKWYPNLFEGEYVVATEKIHGCNFRAGYVPFDANTFWKKVKKFLGLAPKYEFVYGSRNVQLQDRRGWNGYYPENVYLKMVKKYKLEEVLAPGEVIYGEIYGDGIQKGYSYGCEKGEQKAVFFDLMKDGEYLPFASLNTFLQGRGLPIVPTIVVGTLYGCNKLKSLTSGPSVLCPKQEIREGIVVRPYDKEENSYAGRKILKMINDDYLLKDNTEYH